MTDPQPLRGHRILVTRSSHRADDLAARLASLGAEVLTLQARELVPPESFAPLDAALARLAQFDWLIFTSENALPPFFDRLAAQGLGLAHLGHLKVAAIGARTAEALRQRGRAPDLVPDQHVAEALAAAMAPRVHGARVLLPRALVAREVLPERLRAAGALEVCSVPAYRAVASEADPEPARQALARGQVSAVTFASAGTVQAVLDLLGPEAIRWLAGCKVVCIGPVTAAACSEAGMLPILAEESTSEGLVRAIVAELSPGRPS